MNLDPKMLFRMWQTLRRLPGTVASVRWSSSRMLQKAKTLNPEDTGSFPGISSALVGGHHTAKVMFDNHTTADFKYIWLRDNCRCHHCVHSDTRQKLLDTPDVDVNIKPAALELVNSQVLNIRWPDGHESSYDADWLYQYGQCFIHNTFETTEHDRETTQRRPSLELWDRTSVWKNFPELSYQEFMETQDGVLRWLDIFYKYGVALLRNVPPEQDEIINVVKRFAYVKETQYGLTFDVVADPRAAAHLAYSGLFLQHHTDMNYREKSPGMQMLHCLQSHEEGVTDGDGSGKSFFVDGFRIAKWLEEHEPAAFHILSSTPIRFQIINEGQRYSQMWPVICLNRDGDVTEVHYNNRTMGPIQAPTHVVLPFYHAYKLFTQRVREESYQLMFRMAPGDLVAFNNRRILHGRTSYDPLKVSRHLQGCYVDIDEAMSKYDSLLAVKEKTSR